VQNTGTFAIETQDAADAVHDTGTAAGVAITASLLTAVSFAAPTQAADTVETWTVQFTTVNAVGASGDIRIVFPAGFQTSSGAATVCDVTAPGTVTAETTTVASATEVVCNLGAGDSIAAASAVTLTLTNIRNPATAQDPTGAFTLQTRNNADAVHDAHTTNTEVIGAGAQASLGVATIHWLDFGTANSVTDDCAYLDTQGAAAAVAPSNFDIRLLACSGKAPGTLVADGDAAEKNFPVGPLNTAPAVLLKYADVNGNGRYDPGDSLYLGTGAATVLQSSTSPAQFTIRLTPAAGKAAGTLVVVGDSDLSTYANGLQAWTGSLSWLDRDLSPNGEFTPGDDAYLIPRAAGAAQNVLFPSMSLRASAANTAGAFGTQVRLADADALPQVNLGTGPVAAPPAGDLALAGADIVAAPATVRVAPTGIYEDLANPGTVGAGDVRHVSYVPGLLPAVVAAGDSDIGVALSTPSADFPVIAFADAAGDGAATSTLTLGDNLYSAATPGAALTAAHRRYAQLARVLHADLGVVGDYKDNCVYLDVDHSNTVSVLDLRLVPCQGKAAGTMVLDADVTERQAASTAPVMKLVWADAKGNGRLDEADPVYLTTTAGAATTLTPSSSAAAHTIRLTASGGKAAGTFAAAGDTDLASYSTVTIALPAGLAFIDRDMTATFSSGDHAYLEVAASVSLVHKILPLQSIRVNENPNGAYGSWVLVGHADLLQTTGKASIPITPVHYLDFGNAGDFRDDCVYLEMQGTVGAAAVAPTNYDLRLTACHGKGFATSVLDGDSMEKNFPAGALNTAPAAALKYADTNNNARYDPADNVYLATGAATVLPATTGPAQFSIRLTPAAGKPAGSFVVTGDADLAAYSAGVVTLAASVAWFDKDASAGGEHTEGDVVYVLPRTGPGYAAGNLLPLRRLLLAPAAVAAPTTSTSASPSTAPPTTTETATGSASPSGSASSGVPPPAPPATDGAPGQTGQSTSPGTTTQGTPGPWFGALVALALLGAWRMRRRA
jgi:MYXO-CTERM domain-containing protein